MAFLILSSNGNCTLNAGEFFYCSEKQPPTLLSLAKLAVGGFYNLTEQSLENSFYPGAIQSLVTTFQCIVHVFLIEKELDHQSRWPSKLLVEFTILSRLAGMYSTAYS